MAESLYESVGGYACEFVEAVPKELQVECSVCLHILRDPLMVDCCGYRFCKQCLEPLLSSSKKCPLCNCKISVAICDKLLQRVLKQREVYCTNKEKGCNWSGELSTLDNHLNLIAEVSTRLEGCSLQSLKCTYCDKFFFRNEVEKHELNCPERPVSCDFCKAFDCPQYKLPQHWDTCAQYPVDCPQNCGTAVVRAQLNYHLKCDCPMVVVDCKFAYVGCNVTLPRKDMKDHIDKGVKDHLELMSDYCVQLQELNRKEKLNSATLESRVAELSKHREQVIVENLAIGTTEHMLRSVFGQFGCVHSIKLFSSNLVAIVEYSDPHCVHRLFQRYHSTGIKLLKSQLKCIHLE